MRARSQSKGVVGVALVLVGVVAVALDVRGLDDVVITFSPNHGLHLSDVIGSMLVCVGTWLVWHRR